MKRKVTLNLDEELLPNNVHYKAISEAVGYLSRWNLTEWDTVSINHDGKDGDLIAYYSNQPKTTDGPNARMYVIGAVWRGMEYSFHS